MLCLLLQLLCQPKEYKFVQFLQLLTFSPSLLACVLPTISSANYVHSQIQWDNWRHEQDQQYNWCSRQDTQEVEEPEDPQKKSQQDTLEVEEPEAPLDGGSQWLP